MAITNGWNYVNGTNGSDNLEGTLGSDAIYGWNGDDYLLGSDGNDWLWGGAGADTMVGGAGADTFIYFNESEANGDRIQDFDGWNQYDKIDLSAIDADKTTPNIKEAFKWADQDSLMGWHGPTGVRFPGIGEICYGFWQGNTWIVGNTNGYTPNFSIELQGIHYLRPTDFKV